MLGSLPWKYMQQFTIVLYMAWHLPILALHQFLLLQKESLFVTVAVTLQWVQLWLWEGSTPMMFLQGHWAGRLYWQLQTGRFQGPLCADGGHWRHQRPSHHSHWHRSCGVRRTAYIPTLFCKYNWFIGVVGRVFINRTLSKCAECWRCMKTMNVNFKIHIEFIAVLLMQVLVAPEYAVAGVGYYDVDGVTYWTLLMG